MSDSEPRNARPKVSPWSAEKPRPSRWAPAAVVVAISLACGAVYRFMPAAPVAPLAVPAEPAPLTVTPAPERTAAPTPAPSSLDFVRNAEQPLRAQPQAAAPAPAALSPAVQSRDEELRPLAAPQAAPKKEMKIPQLKPLPLLGGRSNEKTSAQVAGYAPAQPPENQVQAQGQAQPTPVQAKPAARPRPRNLSHVDSVGAGYGTPTLKAQAVVAEMKVTVQLAQAAAAPLRPAAALQPLQAAKVAEVLQPASGPQWICAKEMRPLANQAGRPIPRGDPQHDLSNDLALTPIESLGTPWRSHTKVVNRSGRNLVDVEIYGNAGDRWVVSLQDGDWVDLNGLRPNTRYWGK